MSEIHDPYDDQLRAARYRAERDQAREELARAEGGARAARRTYDALSDEDRRILWWVHARGGLRDVKRQRKKSVPREVYERKRAAWRCHIRECEEALRKRNRRIKELENAALERRTVRAEDREAAEWVRGHGGLDDVEKQWGLMADVTGIVGEALWGTPDRVPDDLDEDELRAELLSRLMPEGMEWPRFEDGEPVKLAASVEDDDGDEAEVAYITFHEVHVELGMFNGAETYPVPIDHGERVNRPAPKVLDADGVSIHEGDTVWLTDGRGPWKVSRIVCADRLRVICDDEGNGHLNVFPESITHRAPVLAADGEPLEVGQTVWSVNDGREYKVVIVDQPVQFDTTSIKVDDGRAAGGVWVRPDNLTHQRPVLDAEGVPIREGDTVWDVETGIEFEVSKVDGCAVTMSNGAYYSSAFPRYCPSKLTHTKPEQDSWEKWREEFIKPPCVYCRDILGVEFDNDTELDKAFDAHVQDMERRARALAERGE